MLKRNIFANLAGGGWIALLTLVATPVQIHKLGFEAYGLIGLIAVLQVVFSTLDFGLSAAITQSIASDHSKGWQDSAPVTNSAGIIYGVFALFIAALSWMVAGWIATRWLSSTNLSQSTVLTAVRIIGLYIAIRWPIAFYTGILNGIQRMDVMNLLKSGAATLRIGVGIIVILIWPSVTAFLAWFAISAMVELAAFAIVTHRLLPTLSLHRREFSFDALRSIWRFTLTMASIALLAMIITQMDRLMVSKLLSLEALGYYSLAYTAAIGLSLVQVSINNGALPALSRSATSREPHALQARYERLAEFTSFALALPCFILVFFGADILSVWVSEKAAAGAGLALSVLALGFFFNAAISSAYLASVATRRVGIPAAVNLISLIVYVPILWLLISRWGIVGAALGWALFNVSYLFTLLPLVHRKILRLAVMPWVWRCLILPGLVAILTLGPGSLLAAQSQSVFAPWVALLAGIIGYGVLGIAVMSRELRGLLPSSNRIAALMPREWKA